ncbi:unnamed protein product [Schistocephalus solidus]|uniref:Lipoprotein n=1 Tax=Schistocephalus solidus TaxID=70667 RepID=A0A183SA48_SCHSO|nr:unnamed protein product [Schistocephalus solidus]
MNAQRFLTATPENFSLPGGQSPIDQQAKPDGGRWAVQSVYRSFDRAGGLRNVNKVPGQMIERVYYISEVLLQSSPQAIANVT